MKKITGIILAAVFVLCLSPMSAYASEQKTELSFAYDVSAPSYIIDAWSGQWKKGTTTGISITCNGDIAKFTGFKVDGAFLGTDVYTAVSGSTVVTLTPAYLETLSLGAHTVEFVYSDGSVQATLTILPADTGGYTPPDGGTTPGADTGDTGNNSENPDTGTDQDDEPVAPPSVPNTPGNVITKSADGKYVEYDTDGNAVGEWQWDEANEEWIFDEYPVPLYPADPDYPSPPNTGDSGNALLWLLLGGASAAALGGLLMIGTREKKDTV